jgi:SlyX protein
MQRQLELLAQKIKEGGDSGLMPQHQEPPPPHY